MHMKKFKLSTHQFRLSLAEEGVPNDLIDIIAKRYAQGRHEYIKSLKLEPVKKFKAKEKSKMMKKYGFTDDLLLDHLAKKHFAKDEKKFNVFTSDPNCKSCGKK